MTRKFVMLSEFDMNWVSMGLNDNGSRRLQEKLLFNPEKAMLHKERAVCVSCASRLK